MHNTHMKRNFFQLVVCLKIHSHSSFNVWIRKIIYLCIQVLLKPKKIKKNLIQLI